MATTSTVLGQPALELDGRYAGALRSLQPPGYRVQPAASGAADRGASPGPAVGITPMAAEFDLVDDSPLLAWAQSLLGGKPRTAAGAALQLDAQRKVQRRIAWTDGVPTALRLPTLDATLKQPVTLGLSWQPGSVAYPKAAGEVVTDASSKPARKAPQLGQFRVLGLPFNGAHVQRVALPGINVRGATGGITSGTTDGAGLLPAAAAVDLGELRLDIASAGRDAALAWVVQCVTDAPQKASEALTLTVELLDPSLKTALARLVLSGCGLLACDEPPLRSDTATPSVMSLRLSVRQITIQLAN
ncbi:MAG: hypothetical protein RLY78_1806 [Pseudomonadota bacterium]